VDIADVIDLSDSKRVGRGHQCGAGRTANCLGIEGGEAHSFLCHAVEIWSGDIGGAVTTEVLVALVIGEDDDEV